MVTLHDHDHDHDPAGSRYGRYCNPAGLAFRVFFLLSYSLVICVLGEEI